MLLGTSAKTYLIETIFLQIPQFTPLELGQLHDFRPMLTDTGLCHVYNGNSIGQTFVNVGRNKELKNSFGNGNGFKPAKINGTGFNKEKIFWFDVGIR